MKHFYLVRHCQAEGQAPDAALTPLGRQQAEALASFFRDIPVQRVIASPYLRARDTAEPLARHFGLTVETDSRLEERVLSSQSMPDWYERLRDTFSDLALCYAGGESSRTAMDRGFSLVQEALLAPCSHTVLVTHGGLLSLLLKQLDDSYGFAEWEALTNPDVYRLSYQEDKWTIKRVWNEVAG
ncbi:histidine phosphatase family protein [Brevibacillus borstelensis]|uniref:histidine phosphatase family protein n=1 Tax=Brevibacillus borstelensis TaxID=45462 RepID=UPI0030C4FCFC